MLKKHGGCSECIEMVESAMDSRKRDKGGSIMAVIDDYTGPAMEFITRGFMCVNEGDLDGAIVNYTQALRLDPKNGAAYANRGNAYFMKGDHHRAIEDCTQAIELDFLGKFGLAYQVRGIAYSQIGEDDLALPDLDRAIMVAPNEPYTHFIRGAVYFKKGKYAQAIADYERALLLEPDSPLAVHWKQMLEKARQAQATQRR